jgi:hypothetical protein
MKRRRLSALRRLVRRLTKLSEADVRRIKLEERMEKRRAA